jgi:AraC family transcriptional regulator
LPAYVAIGKSIVSKEPENDSIAFMLQFRLEHKINPLAEIGSDVPVSAEDQVQGRHGYVDYLIVDKETFDCIQDARICKIEVPSAKYLTLTIADPFKDPFERIPLGWQKLVQALEAGHQFNNELVFGGFEEVVKSLIHTQMNLYLAIK